MERYDIMAMTDDTLFMSRALELARLGEGYASPNPMVGAVIVCDGKIIGEGYHRLCGTAHAEVNAVNAVADAALLRRSTIYVTLEPCAHYGKTPPCAELLIRCGIPRVVIGTVDPFARVAGRGIAMLREAGAEVRVGVMERECRMLNRKFFTAHTLHRPYITLKWAQSSDGFMDAERRDGTGAYRFSTSLTTMLTHRLRAVNDAILTTSATVLADDPSLTVRGWCGRQPQVVVMDRNRRLEGRAILHGRADVTVSRDDIVGTLAAMYERNITSALVEAGPRMLSEFIDHGLCDECYVEIAPDRLGADGRHKAPSPTGTLVDTAFYCKPGFAMPVIRMHYISER